MTAICDDKRVRGAKLFWLSERQSKSDATAIVTLTGGRRVGECGLWRASVAEVSTEVADPETQPNQTGTKAYRGVGL